MRSNHRRITYQRKMNYWEIIARNLKKRGWSLGYVSAVDSEGLTIWIADGHRDDGRRFVVRADEKLTAFLELETVIRYIARSSGRDRRSLLNYFGVALYRTSGGTTWLASLSKRGSPRNGSSIGLTLILPMSGSSLAR